MNFISRADPIRFTNLRFKFHRNSFIFQKSEGPQLLRTICIKMEIQSGETEAFFTYALKRLSGVKRRSESVKWIKYESIVQPISKLGFCPSMAV